MKDDGGPAFPASEDLEHDSGYHQCVANSGMSLRDWFAGQTAPAMMAAVRLSPWGPATEPHGRDESMLWGEIARNAYDLADAMIAERKK